MTLAIKDGNSVLRNMATDVDGSTEHWPYVKLGWGANGTQNAASLANPIPTQVVNTPTFLVDDTDAVEVRGNTTCVFVPVTTTATSYAINDIIGGEITVTGLTRSGSVGAVLNSLSVFSDDAVTPELNVMFFQTDLTGGTYTNDGPLTLSAADKQNYIGHVRILAGATSANGDWDTIAADTWACKKGLGLPLKGNNTADLRMIIITKTAITLGSTSAIRLVLGLLRD